MEFQSTLPVGGATFAGGAAIALRDISIHAPRVGSDPGHDSRPVYIFCFNPRSPCGERLSIPIWFLWMIPFQSTLPVWGATTPSSVQTVNIVGFNPRSPCGERLKIKVRRITRTAFQSTLPVWGATYIGMTRVHLDWFQSTLPVWGATQAWE